MASYHHLHHQHAQPKRPQMLLKYDFEKLSNNPSNPPPEYSFLPKGDVYMTRHCRDLTAGARKTVYVVYDHRTNERLGIHCPTEICEAVIEDAAATAKKRQQAVAAKDSKDEEKAEQSIFKEFPRIPPENAYEILKYGFLKGSGRVGRATKLEDDAKVELAVNAHIRHRFTKYDFYMKQKDVSQYDARAKVFSQVQAIANSWRALKPQQDRKQYNLRSLVISSPQEKAPRRSRRSRNKDTVRSLTQAMKSLSTGEAFEINDENERPPVPVTTNSPMQTKKARKQRRAARLADIEKIKQNPQHLIAPDAHLVNHDKACALDRNRRKAKIANRKAKRDHEARILLSQYQLDPNLTMTKKQKSRMLHLETQEILRLGKRQYQRIVDGRRQGNERIFEGKHLPTKQEQEVESDPEWMDIS